jgi:hypothetical protein
VTQRWRGRAQSQIPVPYLREDQIAAWEGPQAPFGARANAAAFVQSNCNVPSGRNLIVSNLLAFPDLEVNSYGKCVARWSCQKHTLQHLPDPLLSWTHRDT